MDVLTDLLERARVNGSVFAVSTWAGPWALDLGDDLPLATHVVLDGDCWIQCGGEHIDLRVGDLVLVGPGRTHRLGSGEPATSLTLAGARRHAVTGSSTQFAIPGDGNSSRILCGSFEVHGGLCTNILATLPPVVVLPRDDHPDLGAVVDIITNEVGDDRPGGATVLNRLLEVVLVRALRHWFDNTADAPGWFAALADPDVGAVLRAMHDRPSAPWSVSSLAATAGLGRATLARRFTDLVGLAPMTYLTRWRMGLAAEAVRETDAAISAIARNVGYRDDAAFTVAFKRTHGVAPTAMRKQRHDGGPLTSAS